LKEDFRVVTESTPSNVLRFPKERKPMPAPWDHQSECLPRPLKLVDQLQRIKDGSDAGMSRADIQNEYDALQAEKVIDHWARKLADNPRRGPTQAATFLCVTAGNLNAEEAS
jgi:hypothetical protein